jgi:hypothetical protein
MLKAGHRTVQNGQMAKSDHRREPIAKQDRSTEFKVAFLQFVGEAGPLSSIQRQLSSQLKEIGAAGEEKGKQR